MSPSLDMYWVESITTVALPLSAGRIPQCILLLPPILHDLFCNQQLKKALLGSKRFAIEQVYHVFNASKSLPFSYLDIVMSLYSIRID